ncbi:reverse transcriptase family protein [Gordonia humi]|uniref:reverse transcriptase family protein n=1 Tax=Gordonia humi TaxID=686429 RepID=UPI003621B6B3
MTGQGLEPPQRFTGHDANAMGFAVSRRMMRLRPAERADAWTWLTLQEMFADTVWPDDADEIAQAVLAVYPEPPSRIQEALTAVIVAMPGRREPFAADPGSSSPVFDVRQIADVEELAAWQNLSMPELDWFAARGRGSRRAPTRLRHYRVWQIPKRHGGLRIIEAPKERLATIQRRILDDVLAHVPPHPAAHGFRPRALGHVVRGSARAARRRAPHRSAPLFRTCHVSASQGGVHGDRVPAGRRRVPDGAVHDDDRGRRPATHRLSPRGTAPGTAPAPGGAPTSPALLNLVLRRTDIRIAGFAAANRLTYTRYGDDLALSGDDVDVGRVLWAVSSIIRDEGFTVHPDKVRVMGEHQRQQLTGLVVNAGPRAARADYDALKALLHNAIRDGGQSQNRAGRDDFRAYVYGRIGWVSTGSQARRRKLTEMAARVDWER